MFQLRYSKKMNDDPDADMPPELQSFEASITNYTVFQNKNTNA